MKFRDARPVKPAALFGGHGRGDQLAGFRIAVQPSEDFRHPFGHAGPA